MLRLTSSGGCCLIEFKNAYRPRWAANKRETTRLTPAEVARCGIGSGGSLVRYRGAFFFGMQAYRHAPEWLVPTVDAIDRALSALLPRLCARCYLLFQKDPSAAQ